MAARVLLWVVTMALVLFGSWFRARLATGVDVAGGVVIGRLWWVEAVVLLVVVVAAAKAVPWVVAVCRRRSAVVLLAGAGLVLLALPLAGPLGHDVGGARVGVRVPALGAVQLVPLALLLLTVAAAAAISRWPDDANDGVIRYLGVGGISAAAALLLAAHKDFGPLLVLLVAVGLVGLAGGRRTAPLLAITFVSAVAAVFVASPIGLVRRRLAEWLVEGGGEQLQIAWAMAVEAGWPGQGLRFGRPGDIPLAAQDLALIALVEIGGLMSLLVLGALWVINLSSGARLATGSDDADRTAIASGIVALLAAKVTVAFLMQTGILPFSGLATPLLSVGYSTLVIDAASLGLLLGLAGPSPWLGEAAQRRLAPQVAVWVTLMAVSSSLVVLEIRDDVHLDADVAARRDTVNLQAQRNVVSSDGQLLAATRFNPNGQPRVELVTDDVLPAIGIMSPQSRSHGLFADAESFRCRLPGWHAWSGDDDCVTPVEVTLDARLQAELMDTVRSLGDGHATAMLLTPQGELLAAGSSLDPIDLDALLDAPNAATFQLSAFNLLGPPGSTIKPMLGAVAHPWADELDLPLTSSVTLPNGARVSSWQDEGCGGPVQRALQRDSCNPTAVEALRLVGFPAFAAAAKEIGYGRDISGPGTDIAVSSLPDEGDDAYLAAIGQGSTRATVAQQALLAATLANGGDAPEQITLLREGPTPTSPSLAAEAVAEVMAGMGECVSSGSCGPGLAALGSPTAAKTGTAQQPDAGNLGWCIAAAPIEAPRIAAAMRIDPANGDHASGRQACNLLAPLLQTALELP